MNVNIFLIMGELPGEMQPINCTSMNDFSFLPADSRRDDEM